MKKILIINGPGGDAQGWGDLKVTEQLCDALNSMDKSAEIVFVEKKEELQKAIDKKSYDIIWSAFPFSVSLRCFVFFCVCCGCLCCWYWR